MGPLLKLVQVPLDGIPSFQRVDCITQLGVVCKLPEVHSIALSVSLKIINSTGPNMDP